MALIHSFENDGNWLFKKRGQIPVILFLLAIPAVYLSSSYCFSNVIVKSVTILAIVLSITGAWIRAYTIGTTPRGTSGRNTDKQVADQLNFTGIYSTVRHPLYVGNYLMWIGIVLFTFNFSFVIIVSLLYWLYYERIMFAEERFLEKKFGEQFLQWSLTVPAFIPAISKFTKSSVPFSFISVLRREYSGWLATVIGFWFVDFLRSYFTTGDFAFNFIWTTVLLVFAVKTMVLRSLKHYTSLLDEEGRS